MSSIPGYTLEKYIAWRCDLRIVDGDETNVSVGMASALGLIEDRRLAVTQETLGKIATLLEHRREDIEDALMDFDEDNQSWRSYADAVEGRAEDSEWDIVDKFVESLKATPEAAAEFIDKIRQTTADMARIGQLTAGTGGYELPQYLYPDKVALYDELRKFIENNPAREAPYHNNVHMGQMTCLAFRLYEAGEKCKPSDQDAIVMLLAGMLHDYEHSAGKRTDDLNIICALHALERFVRFSPFMQGIENKVRRELLHDLAEEAICCTEFPFVHEPKSLAQMYLRDADLLYAASTGNPSIILEDLRKEIATSMGREVSYEEMLEGQVKFMGNAKLYTKPGQELHQLVSRQYLEAMVAYVESKKHQ